MRPWNKSEILKHAIMRSNSSTLNFVKSEAVANQVAAKVRTYLAARGRGNTKVTVVRSVSHPGTWAVRVHLPGLHRQRLGSQGNRRDVDLAIEALRASYGPQDLVDTWNPDSLR